MAASLRIVLADDHAPTRLGVRRALERADFEIVAEADDAQGAIQAVLEHRPDLCLLDIYMPGGGINAAARLSEAMPELPIVMLTASSADDDLFEALRAGACGYLLKDTDPRAWRARYVQCWPARRRCRARSPHGSSPSSSSAAGTAA
jgi:two-component system nitrate/nitrite response regulator NarL